MSATASEAGLLPGTVDPALDTRRARRAARQKPASDESGPVNWWLTASARSCCR